MAHYAFINDQNIVTEVIVGRNEDEVVDGVTDWEAYYAEFRGQTCKRTSYNTQGGAHTGDGTPYRKNYAGIGYTWDEGRDAFIPPKPYPSWVLNEDSCLWEAPVAMPDDGQMYTWNEETTSWDVVTE
jgi:hypothetical protein